MPIRFFLITVFSFLTISNAWAEGWSSVSIAIECRPGERHLLCSVGGLTVYPNGTFEKLANRESGGLSRWQFRPVLSASDYVASIPQLASLPVDIESGRPAPWLVSEKVTLVLTDGSAIEIATRGSDGRFFLRSDGASDLRKSLIDIIEGGTGPRPH